MKIHAIRIILFSVKKTFTINHVVNKLNERVLSFSQDVYEVWNISSTKYPACVMRLGVVSSDGEKILSVWFSTGYRLTAADWKNSFGSKVVPWVNQITKKAAYIIQQDGAPAQAAKIVLELLRPTCISILKISGPYNPLIAVFGRTRYEQS